MRYHGNYCGPNWSAGLTQPSVVSDVAAIDDFDETCKVHDAAYATGADLRAADLAFAAENLATFDLKRNVAGTLVGLQGLGRPRDKSTKLIKNTNMSPNPTRARRAARTAAIRGISRSLPASSSSPLMRMNGNQNQISAPTAIATRRTGAAPRMQQRGSGITVSHRAFLGPVINTVTYTVNGYQANPGLADTFPWLSSLASRYDKYRFTSLVFEYRSVANTSVNGIAMMSFDYNASDAAPLSKVVQAQTIPNSENNVWISNSLSVPCDSTWRYVRQGTVPNTDIKTYDLGTMWLSTQYGGTATCGELYVEYTVELDKPSEPTNLAQRYVATAPLVAAPLAPGGNVAGSLPIYSIGTSDSLWLCRISGIWLFTIEVTGTVITNLINPTSTTSTITTIYPSVINTAQTRASYTFAVTATRGDVLNFSAALAAASCTQFALTTTPYITTI